MVRIRTMSLHIKFILILLLAVSITILAGFIAAYQLRTAMLRNTAQAVAEQVVAFRSWVAGPGVVWVNTLQPSSLDYLSKVSGGANTFYSKNPALATRELSAIVARSSVKATFRVSSDNYRNASNTPDPFEMQSIHTFKTDLARAQPDRKEYVETFTNNRYRYAVPIKVEQSCLRCHGTPQEAPVEVVEKYGAAKAFGYRVGDIRGIITVDLPVESLLVASPALNGYSLGLVVLAFAINFILLKKLVIDRIKQLTTITKRMAHGEKGLKFTGQVSEDSRDEIDLLCDELDVMKKSAATATDSLKK